MSSGSAPEGADASRRSVEKEATGRFPGEDPDKIATEQGRKLFIGGLSRYTSDLGFQKFFERFGDLENSVIMRVRSSGASRGFGFITYKDKAVADKVVSMKDSLELDGWKLEPKIAVPIGQGPPPAKTKLGRGPPSHRLASRSPPRNRSRSRSRETRRDSYRDVKSSDRDRGVQYRDMDRGFAPYSQESPSLLKVNKIFIGGLSPAITSEDLRKYFSKYGEITDAHSMMDNRTGLARGFGFVTFASHESVEEVVKTANHVINGKRVDAKKAFPKDAMDHPGRLRTDRGLPYGAYPPYPDPYQSAGYDYNNAPPMANPSGHMPPYTVDPAYANYPYPAYGSGSGYGYGPYDNTGAPNASGQISNPPAEVSGGYPYQDFGPGPYNAYGAPSSGYDAYNVQDGVYGAPPSDGMYGGPPPVGQGQAYESQYGPPQGYDPYGPPPSNYPPHPSHVPSSGGYGASKAPSRDRPSYNPY